MKCKTCGHEIEPLQELFKSKVLGLTLTKIQDWDKTYNQIVIPEGFRLIKAQELITLFESNEENDFLGNYKNKYNWFWCEQTKYDKRNNHNRRVGRNDGGNWWADNDILADSNDYGRMVFVEENK